MRYGGKAIKGSENPQSPQAKLQSHKLRRAPLARIRRTEPCVEPNCVGKKLSAPYVHLPSAAAAACHAARVAKKPSPPAPYPPPSYLQPYFMCGGTRSPTPPRSCAQTGTQVRTGPKPVLAHSPIRNGRQALLFCSFLFPLSYCQRARQRCLRSACGAHNHTLAQVPADSMALHCTTSRLRSLALQQATLSGD